MPSLYVRPGRNDRARRRHPSQAEARRGSAHAAATYEVASDLAYSTVTVLARLRGWSTFSPRSRAIRYARSWSGITARIDWRKFAVRGTKITSILAVIPLQLLAYRIA